MSLPLLLPPALIVAAPVFNDDKATALLAEIAAKGKSLKSFSAELSMSVTGPQNMKQTGTLRLQSPGKGRVELKPESGEGMLMLSDGQWDYSVTGKKYRKTKATPDGIWPFLSGIPGAEKDKVTYAGKEKLGEVECDVLELKEGPQTIRFFVNPDKLIQRFVMSASLPDGKMFSQEIQLSNLQLDTELAADTFALPAGLEEIKEPSGGGMADLEAKLLKVGSKAPAFNLATPTGGKLSLAQALKGKKAVLVNFWFYNCGPCRAEHPELQKLYARLKSKGLGLVAVDQGDDNKTILSYMKKAGLTFPAVKGVSGTFSAYGVQAFPTNYLVGADGKILYRSVGFDEAGLKAALAKAGLK